MPNFLIHALVGLVLGLLVLSTMGITPATPALYGSTILLLVVSSLLPDIDHEYSFATRIIISLASVLVIYVFYRQLEMFLKLGFNNIILEAVALLIIFILVHHTIMTLYRLLKPKHRGFIHSYASAILFAAGSYVITLDVYAAGVILLGYVSHLLADGLFFKVT